MSITPELLELVSSDVPAPPTRFRTIFDISGNTYDERVFSRWYEYFLDKQEDHGLSDLFLRTLLSLLNSDLKFTDYKVAREVQTRKGNFIDILVIGTGVDEGKFLIIENKVNHILDNDLQDYWDSCPGKDENKAAVLLTVGRHHTPANVRNLYKNILHKEWFSELNRKMGSIDLTPEQKHLFFQFATAIENLSKDLHMNEQVLFFLNNITQINKILATREQATLYILNQLEAAGEQLGLEVGARRSDFYRTFQFPQINNIFYTILYDQLLTDEQVIRVFLEVNGANLQRLDELDKTLLPEIQKKGLLHRSKENSYYAHYVGKAYMITREDMANLAHFLANAINEDFSQITEKTVGILHSPVEIES
ncbi:PD-(D/E)XK nuclease family protein [Chitinophagaceae bacterium LB-8]|uniref:PD-(D/E)XK nuclease family protein n=1 Tax=Paraflavisolibacter caeni TaxID=2982496 RepID=A0A9X2XW99_9BACT|nr:PD-(D/E)XK nuclease family protein [Paraflavisolibacter caeni]MCU7549826.1 PD-(D/E)XK nuclease family protein [Paraflavisolibacter caeni]